MIPQLGYLGPPMTDAEASALYRLTYLSCAKRAMPADELGGILEASRRNNAKRGVTGLLIYHDMQFFQTLEGAAGEVESLYTHIARDPRHSQCVRLEFRPVVTRYFGDWSMAYRTVNELGSAGKKNLLDLTRLGKRLSGSEQNDDPRTHILIGSFLSGFRDLDLA
jgi:Sensors of blue-light using FAD